MAAIKGLIVPITATYDGKGVNQATTALGKLESSAKSIAKTFAGLFVAEKIVSFGKAAVDAFAADQKAAAELTQTMTNLGLAFDTTGVQTYLTKLSELYGITKEKLSPAFLELVRYTKDTTSAQQLLQSALDISAGTGKDLLTVSTALGKAYGGNNTALSKLGAGLTQAQLKTNSFAQNMKVLNLTFKGDAKASAETFQGTLDRLKTTAHDAAVEVGGSLVASFSALGSLGASDPFHWIKTLGSDLSGIIYQATKFVIVTKDMFKGAFSSLHNTEAVKQTTKDLNQLNIQYNKTLVPYRQGLGITEADAIAKAQALKDSAANLILQKKLTAEANSQLLATKAKNVLDTAGKVLNLQNIEIQAALAQSSDYNINQRLQLQEDLLNGNATAAGALAQQILATNAAALQSSQIDPYGHWISGASDALTQIKALQDALAQNGAATFAITPALQASTASALDAANLDAANALVGADQVNTDTQSFLNSLVTNTSSSGSTKLDLTVTTSPGITVTQTQNATANGSPLTINRLTNNWGTY